MRSLSLSAIAELLVLTRGVAYSGIYSICIHTVSNFNFGLEVLMRILMAAPMMPSNLLACELVS